MADGAAVGHGTRPLPHNIELEQSVLGAVLLDNSAYERVSDTITSDDFSEPVHRLIYQTAGDMIAAGRRANPVTLKEHISGLPTADYLGRLAINAATVHGAVDYAKTLKSLATRRGLIEIARAIEDRAFASTAGDDPAAQVADAETLLFELIPKSAGDRQTVSAGEALGEVITTIAEAYERGNATTGVSTGFPSIDAEIGGMDHGDLVIIAGRPSMGKSALAMNIANAIATRSGPVLVFSQEMSAAQIMIRTLAESMAVPISALRSGRLSEQQFRGAIEASRRLSSLPLYIDQTGGLTLPRLTAKARRAVRRCEHAAIVVDYLQLMHGGSRYAGNRNNELAEITTGLKALAKEFSLPIILLSQLNREGAKRDNKRPQITDLRDSGAIEQDADIVLMVHRPDYYLERERPPETDLSRTMEWEAAMMTAQGRAEIIVAKARQGRAGGIINLKFDGPTTSFSEISS